MPVSRLHSIKNMINEFARYCLMEQIAHRVDENHSGLPPTNWLTQALRTKGEVKTGGEWVVPHVAKSLCEPLSIAVVAPTANFGATGYRVPRRVRPLDGARASHCRKEQ